MAASGILYALSRFIVREWEALFSLMFKLAPFLKRRQSGLFEILDYDSTLELCDEQGKTAIIHRWQKIRFLQNHVVAFQDFVWGGDGEQMANYKIAPGSVAKIYTEGKRWNVLSALDEVSSKGDVAAFYIERTIRNGFLQDTEWRETEIWKPTKRIRLAIVFPRDRQCKRAVLLERSADRSTALGTEHFRELPDGRQMLVWEKKRPRQAEVYTLKWEW
jgi:hypothetical protein